MLLYEYRDTPIVLIRKNIDSTEITRKKSFKIPGVIQSINISGRSVHSSGSNNKYLTTEYGAKNIGIELVLLNKVTDNPLDLIFNTSLSKMKIIRNIPGKLETFTIKQSIHKQIKELENNIFGINSNENKITVKKSLEIFQIIHSHINARGIHYIIPKYFSTIEDNKFNIIKVSLDFVEVIEQEKS